MKSKRQFKLFLLLTSLLTGYSHFASAEDAAPFDPTVEEITQQLGWIPDDRRMCGGHYKEPLSDFVNTPLPPLATTPIEISANKGTFRFSGASVITGNATLSQPGRLVNAESIQLNRNATTGEFTTADISGNVVIREPNKLIVGKTGHIEVTKRTGNLNDGLYRLMVGSANPLATTNIEELNAWGKADLVQQDENGVIELQRATYTTCTPTSQTWKVSASKIDLNSDTGRGVATNTWLSLAGVPVLYTPYFSFPLDDRRQTGFLFPTFGSSSLSGATLGVPFYWNIAPNYDALFTPEIFEKRGLQINGMFRYLGSSGGGVFRAGFTPHDSAFDKFKDDSAVTFAGNPALGHLIHSNSSRSLFSWQDKRDFGSGWTTGVNYNYVSDDYYLQDFGGLSTLSPNLLQRSANVSHADEHWNFETKLQNYQTLHLVNQTPVSNPYNIYPAINLNGYYPNQIYGLNFQIINQFMYFERASNPGELITPPEAGRLHIQPVISRTFAGLPGYITPTLQLSATHYNIGNQLPGFANSIEKTIPMFNIDSGLYFYRNAQWSEKNYQQTLEPRIFYLYVPYRNQTSVPTFDTSLIPFNYNSLFLTNRFSSYDRIGDANQISFALTTRVLDPNGGNEKFSASLGEIYYFEDRRVNLCSGVDLVVNASPNATCANPAAIIGSTSPTESLSPLAGQLSYHFSNHWNTSANVAWDHVNSNFVNGNVNLSYHPQINHVINFNYNYIRYGDPIVTMPATPATSHKNDLNQTGFSFAWPVRENWQLVGGWNYNFSREYSQTYFYGLQYDSCCWAVRAVAGRTLSSINQNGNPVFNNTVYLQLQLKGLGTVTNNNPSNLLLGNIPGYQDSFQTNYFSKLNSSHI